ncbi:cation diffusion facilitator family transporter, partial [Mycobacterium avium subsp. paratuberculosis]
MGAGHNHTPAETGDARLIPRMVMAAAILAAFF